MVHLDEIISQKQDICQYYRTFVLILLTNLASLVALARLPGFAPPAAGLAPGSRKLWGGNYGDTILNSPLILNSPHTKFRVFSS